jgi:hypothetical protein
MFLGLRLAFLMFFLYGNDALCSFSTLTTYQNHQNLYHEVRKSNAFKRMGSSIKKAVKQAAKSTTKLEKAAVHGIEKDAKKAAKEIKSAADKMCKGVTGFMNGLVSALLNNPLMKFIVGLMKFPPTIKKMKDTIFQGTKTLIDLRKKLCEKDISTADLNDMNNAVDGLISRMENQHHDMVKNDVFMVIEELDKICGMFPTAVLMATPKHPLVPDIGLLLATFCLKTSMEDLKILYIIKRTDNLQSYALQTKGIIATRIEQNQKNGH